MKTLPLIVVSGFLSAGKTKWVTSYISHRRTSAIGIVYFEKGMTSYDKPALYCSALTPYAGNEKDIPKKLLQTVAADIIDYINTHAIRDIIFEWNGMLSIQLLQRLIYETPLHKYVQWKGLFYVSNLSFLQQQLGKTGMSTLNQLANADVLIIDQPLTADVKANLRTLTGRRIPVSLPNQWKAIDKKVKHTSRRSWAFTIIGILVLFYLCAVYGSFLAQTLHIPGADLVSHWCKLCWPKSLNQVVTIILGIVLQAFPFLLLGTLVSSALQLYIPPSVPEKLLSQSPLISLPAALFLGFLFPVCDCATIPVFRGLLAKKVPIPAAMTFLLSAPIINPIVIISTYYAFSGNVEVVVGRTLLGAFSALLIGLSFASYTGLSHLQQASALPASLCSCSINDIDGPNKPGRFQQFLLHSKEEFMQVAGFLLMGATLSALFQVYGTPIRTMLHLTNNLPLAVVLMMAFAFCLSLCSTSDAMVARSLGSAFPRSASISFLLFGPIMDIKNMLVYSAYFPKKFCIRLFFTSIIVTLISTFIFAFITGGILL